MCNANSIENGENSLPRHEKRHFRVCKEALWHSYRGTLAPVKRLYGKKSHVRFFPIEPLYDPNRASAALRRT